jgi:hypothetical protein
MIRCTELSLICTTLPAADGYGKMGRNSLAQLRAMSEEFCGSE